MNIISLKDKKDEIINKGKRIVSENQFYDTLNLLLKYYFIQEQDLYSLNFIKEVTKTENEFKVFMVFKEYGLYLYHNFLKDILRNEIIENIVYGIIGCIKETYDNDRNVIKPFITTLEEHADEVMHKFNFITSTYTYKMDTFSKFENLNKAIEYLEKSRELERHAKDYSNKAMEILQNLRGSLKKNLENSNDNIPKILTIK
jgi:hypothetical protein